MIGLFVLKDHRVALVSYMIIYVSSSKLTDEQQQAEQARDSAWASATTSIDVTTSVRRGNGTFLFEILDFQASVLGKHARYKSPCRAEACQCGGKREARDEGTTARSTRVRVEENPGGRKKGLCLPQMISLEGF